MQSPFMKQFSYYVFPLHGPESRYFLHVIQGPDLRRHQWRCRFGAWKTASALRQQSPAMYRIRIVTSVPGVRLKGKDLDVLDRFGLILLVYVPVELVIAELCVEGPLKNASLNRLSCIPTKSLAEHHTLVAARVWYSLRNKTLCFIPVLVGEYSTDRDAMLSKGLYLGNSWRCRRLFRTRPSVIWACLTGGKPSSDNEGFKEEGKRN